MKSIGTRKVPPQRFGNGGTYGYIGFRESWELMKRVSLIVHVHVCMYVHCLLERVPSLLLCTHIIIMYRCVP